MRQILLTASALLTLFTTASAEPISWFMPDGVRYDEAIPVPDDYLRHGMGDKPVRHDQLVGYLSELAEASDRIAVETIGYTHEGRPILFFTVTSPENHENLDDIREAHLARVRGDEDADSDTPMMIWLNYGVHGAESSGMDAVIPSLYHFAAARDAETQETLERSVLLVVGILNPDGHSRRANYVETYAGDVPVTDPAHIQHNMWTEARTNHYWFDLNRQWLLQTQPESRAWVSKWHEWKPHVSADFHEMGSEASYYFHPGEPKRLNPLIPDQARVLTKRIADRHRDFMDSEQRLYFTEQGFDNFYIGKGSTYPQVNGGLGILFEAGAARGGKIETANGERTYADNIRTHFRTTLSTIKGSLEQEDEIKAFQDDFFETALEEAANDDTKAYVFFSGSDLGKTNRFLDVLRQHDVTVHHLSDTAELDESKPQGEGDAYIVPLDQRQYRMVLGIFDRVTEFEENIFYDVSGWTLTDAYDLVSRPVDEDEFDAGMLGEEVTSVTDVPQVKAPAPARYGYVFDWSEYYAPRALYRLLSEDVLVRIASEPFDIRTAEGDVAFERGAVFVPLIRQEKSDEEIHAIMEEIAREDGITVTAATSGAADVATDAVGGRSFSAIEKPSVLLLVDDGLAPYDAGEIWHLLDHTMKMPVTIRRKGELRGLDWSRYTHLLMVGGGNVGLSDSAEKRVSQWVSEEGGTLIAMRQSAVWAQENILGVEAEDDDAKDEDEEETPLRLNYSEMDEKEAEHIIGGAIFLTDIDPSHPIGYGYEDRHLPVLRNTTLTLEWPEDDPYAVVAAYEGEDDLLLSGYTSERRIKEIADTPAVIAERKGRGAVILIADNPSFRATFLGSQKLVMNSIFFSQTIRRASGDYEEE
ncbi:M14 family zinc carboxypeptidase [Parvularcula marina]|uniref:Peptidase n=1 Tax=Parvularcula marina TaxID=2292771 RepID=A0A371RKL2_9PROT|nr:M14 family zinc carboxypeptidase [Parvularcula marina]RFB05993.1 peptidase [Parvularcula marina]